MTADRSSIRRKSSSFIDGLSAIECSHALDDFVQLALCQLGIDRQRKHLVRGALRFRTRTLLVAEVGETRLEGERQWIVDRRADAALLEETLKFVTAIGANRVLIEDRFIRALDERHPESGDISERTRIIGRVGASLGAPRREMRQLCTQYRRLQCIEAAVETHLVVEILLGATMHAEPLEPGREPFVLRDHHSAVAITAKVLRRAETECPDG